MDVLILVYFLIFLLVSKCIVMYNKNYTINFGSNSITNQLRNELFTQYTYHLYIERAHKKNTKIYGSQKIQHKFITCV